MPLPVNDVMNNLRKHSNTAIKRCAWAQAVRLNTQLMGALCLLFLSACTTYEYRETVNVPINTMSDEQEASLDEALLLDVGVVLFDHGVDELNDEEIAFLGVRKSEAVWFTSQLKTTLDRSNAWGSVRALPIDSGRMDVMINGRLLSSDGERVALNIVVQDAGGNVWFEKVYEQTASQYAYNPEVNLPGDPFQALFNRIANDVFDYRVTLSDKQLLATRSITKVLFAQDFVPAAFQGYVAQDENGHRRLLRIPSAQDPLLLKVDRIRTRNDLFLDVIQDYYRAFNNTMSVPYQEWRKVSYKEVIRERQLREQARKEKIAGVVVMAGGVAAASSSNSGSGRAAGFLGTIYGSQVFARSFSKQNQAMSHSETLREMGTSLELELEPSVVDLQDRSVTLSGTVEDQFIEWRRILSRMFELEEGESSTYQGDVSAATNNGGLTGVILTNDDDNVTAETDDIEQQ